MAWVPLLVRQREGSCSSSVIVRWYPARRTYPTPLAFVSPVTRIFGSLAWFALVLMGATLIVGLSIGDFHANHSPEMRRWATVHRLAGVASALMVVLVNSIVVTYFIGTSRWCKEVSETYALDPALVRRSTALKRRTFPWAVMAMLAVLGVIALGAAADPATGLPHTLDWVTPHLLGAICGLAFITWAFFVEWQNIQFHHVVIEDVLAEVKRIRLERGLEI